MRRRDPVRVSAHRCLTREQVEAALALDVDFVEFDLQRCADGGLVVHHDPVLEVDGGEVELATVTAAEARALVPGLLGYAEVLALLAGRRRAHIDLKASASRSVTAVAAVEHAVSVLGAENFLVTTGRDETVRAIRDWADGEGITVLAGLSLGSNTHGFSLLEQLRIRWSELVPRHRVRQSRASVVVAHHSLAMLGVARFARRHGLPLVVWTVDTRGALRHWMRPGRAWLVTTNHPALALELRAAEKIRS